jgi:hypothetical protein
MNFTWEFHDSLYKSHMSEVESQSSKL